MKLLGLIAIKHACFLVALCVFCSFLGAGAPLLSHSFSGQLVPLLLYPLSKEFPLNI